MNLHTKLVAATLATVVFYHSPSPTFAEDPNSISPLHEPIMLDSQIPVSDSSTSHGDAFPAVAPADFGDGTTLSEDEVSVSDLLDMAAERYKNLARRSPEIQGKWAARHEDALQNLKRLMQDPKFVAELKKLEEELRRQVAAKSAVTSSTVQNQNGSPTQDDQTSTKSEQPSRTSSPTETKRPVTNPPLDHGERPHAKADPDDRSFVRSGQFSLPMPAEPSVPGTPLVSSEYRVTKPPVVIEPAGHHAEIADLKSASESAEIIRGAGPGKLTDDERAKLGRLIQKLREVHELASEFSEPASH